jgi:hypothetical protein
MKIKDLFAIIKFVWKSQSCIILRHDFQLSEFGDLDDKMWKLHDGIMHISIKDK